MPVPLLDLKPQHEALAEEMRAAFARVYSSGQFILGPEVEALEREMAAYLEVPETLAVSSGTDALLLALMALGIGPGDEVIVPAFTFFATAGCVARVGATPVFADVCPVCFNLTAPEVERRLTPRTRAVIPVHLFGQSAPLAPLLDLARDRGLAVIEDAAQSLGARYRDRPSGTLGDFGAYSFFPTKNLGALGDAGLLVARDPALARRARLLRVHGMEPKYYHGLIGGNFRIDALQAAFLRIKLPHLDRYCAARRANAQYYQERLAGLPGVARVAPSPDRCPGGCLASTLPADLPAAADPGHDAVAPRILLPTALSDCHHIWNQFTLRVPGPGRRDALRRHLQERGIGSEIYYPVPLHRQSCFAHFPTSQVSLPVAETLAEEVLSLPIFPELSPAQRAEVADALASA